MKVLIHEKLSPHKQKTPEGYLVCMDAVLARTGDQEYKKCELFGGDDETVVKVMRNADQVFAPETLASFENKPLTCEHPEEDVTPDNYKTYSVGFVRDVHRGKLNGEDVILGNIIVTDPDCINDIEHGVRTDLSCGYNCDITDGDHPEQINIRGNHVALCEEGRAGIARIVDSKVKDETKKKAVARYGEPENIFHYWKEMSSKEAENIAKQRSIDNPRDMYYVIYDDIMNPSSGLYWVKGKSYANYTEALRMVDSVKEMALSRQDAIDRCYSLGKKFIEHFDKAYKNPDSESTNHWLSEMQAWFNQAKDITLKENKRPISKNNLVDWFFTATGNPESFMNNPLEAELAAYDDFTYKVLLNNAVKASFEEVKPDTVKDAEYPKREFENIPLRAREALRKSKNKVTTLLEYISELEDFVTAEPEETRAAMKERAEKIISDLKEQFGLTGEHLSLGDAHPVFTEGFRELTPEEVKAILKSGKSYPELLDEYPDVRSSTLHDLLTRYNMGFIKLEDAVEWIVFEEFGKVKATPEDNYNKNPMDANKVMKLDGYTVPEAVEYLKANGLAARAKTSAGDANQNKLPANIRKELQRIFASVSTFVNKRDADKDVADYLNEWKRWFKIGGHPIEFVRESIDGWNKMDDGMMRKDYVFSVDGYSDKFRFSVYADPVDYKLSEVNVYFIDSVKTMDKIVKSVINKNDCLHKGFPIHDSLIGCYIEHDGKKHKFNNIDSAKRYIDNELLPKAEQMIRDKAIRDRDPKDYFIEEKIDALASNVKNFAEVEGVDNPYINHQIKKAKKKILQTIRERLKELKRDEENAD